MVIQAVGPTESGGTDRGSREKLSRRQVHRVSTTSPYVLHLGLHLPLVTCRYGCSPSLSELSDSEGL